nr:upf0481 protein [Quercus suber]
MADPLKVLYLTTTSNNLLNSLNPTSMIFHEFWLPQIMILRFSIFLVMDLVTRSVDFLRGERESKSPSFASAVSWNQVYKHFLPNKVLQEKGTCHSEKMEMSTISSESSYEKELECKEIIIQNPQWRPECCIYMVPKRLREVKKEAYTPRLISVGPLHRNIDASNEMEMLKQKYFQEFFHRTWKDRMEFENIVKKNEENIRHCYAAEISLLGKEDFVKMILLDSIFIIELFLRTATRQEYEKDDYILSKPWLDEGIKHDLILLENQLPFFILDELHHHIGRDISTYPGTWKLEALLNIYIVQQSWTQRD